MKHLWSITMGSFTPHCSRVEDGRVIVRTPHDGTVLAEVIIADHINRSPFFNRTRNEYRVENYVDEMKIYVHHREGNRSTLLVNLQYEGIADD